MRNPVLFVSTLSLAFIATSSTALAKKAAEAPAPPAAPAPPPPPPEIKLTTDAFVGTWTGQATMTMGTQAPASFPVTLNCTPVGNGNGAGCTMSGTSPMGPMSGMCMAAFDGMGSTGVHFMCVTSDGEVHDHQGKWTDATHIVMNRLSWSGGPAGDGWEDLSFAWTDASNMTSTSTMGMPDGTTMKFEIAAKRGM